jgi:hypothetical protein
MERKKRTSFIASVIVATLVAISAVSPAAQSSNAGGVGLRIEGTWRVQVTLRNCATGAALGTVNSLVTFAPGGTLSETPGAGGFAPGQRSDGQGYWTHDGGHVYSQRFVALIRFETPANPPTSPGFLAGWQTVTHQVEIIDPNHLSSSGTNAFFDANGTPYRTGCSTALGTRFE